MLDIKLIRSNPEAIAHALKKKGYNFNLQEWEDLESARKSLQLDTETMQADLNAISKEIGVLKKSGQNSEEAEKSAAEISTGIKKKSAELDILLNQITEITLNIPNVPDDDVPFGKDESENLEIRKWGEPKELDFKTLDHLELGKIHNGIDMELGVKIAGSRFSLLRSDFAKLQRSLINFMLDTHTQEHGYEELYVPYIVNKDSLIGTGQLPKFEEDLFKLEGDHSFYLTSTAEVPVTNVLRDVILDSKELPIKYVAHTPCFRSEAGSYGTDTKGLMRLHQFEKVELVQAVEESDSEQSLEELTSHAENILQKLELPYRVVNLCGGDLGFSSAKTYDLEAWIPSQSKYREISSCSNFRTFQARRLQARWRDNSEKPEMLSTINGSGLALSRTLLALLENFQQKDGTISIPDALRNHFGSDKILVK
jgi:seryl-tRNA synthetase|tara:strand:+ start:689 stop:1963 length:1275 start_codon:yes stop_codon:yes gene_type:complete